tara:strand:- start:179 stop:331 length:153 start_codon:yes stop_codon:yes gene_type:complete
MYDLVIVGAGIAGLNMTRLYLNKYPDKTVCIIEKTDILRNFGIVKKENYR